MAKSSWWLVTVVGAFGAFAACGGTIQVEGDPDSGQITPFDAGHYPDGAPIKLDARPDVKPDGPIVIKKDAGPDSAYIDPDCPVRPEPQQFFDCDVTKQTGCQPGEACYPFVDYPTDVCVAETYGSACVPAGTGTQGTACGGGSQLTCAAGYVCVITGAGTQCAHVCDLKKAGSCPEGLVCDQVDVSGVGVCN